MATITTRLLGNTKTAPKERSSSSPGQRPGEYRYKRKTLPAQRANRSGNRWPVGPIHRQTGSDSPGRCPGLSERLGLRPENPLPGRLAPHGVANTILEDCHVRHYEPILTQLLLWLFVGLTAGQAVSGEMESVRVSDDQRSFVLEKSRRPFIPWGFNYDHDETGRLLEDYWNSEWPKIEQDFGEMKQLGANVVRVHLQFGKFMKGPNEPNETALKQYARLVALAEKTRLYLDVTGLGCYHKKDVPKWYDRLGEEGRWAAQARFWEAVAGRSARSPAVFCYDLMNEPVVPGGERKAEDWLGPEFAGSCFVQCISLSQADRPRPAIARRWIQRLSAAIRKQDRRHLITVGLVDWSLDRPGLSSGFVPGKIIADLDFLCVHLYPEAGKSAAALATLAGFAAGKPVVIEETFPLACSLPEFERFLDGSRKTATGWIGFYWGKTPDECRRSKTIADAMMLGWLELFQQKAKEYTSSPVSPRSLAKPSPDK
jgi:hypothetical protein